MHMLYVEKRYTYVLRYNIELYYSFITLLYYYITALFRIMLYKLCYILCNIYCFITYHIEYIIHCILDTIYYAVYIYMYATPPFRYPGFRLYADGLA